MIYLQLFISFLEIGAFSFGGGYAAMPLIEEQVVELHRWLSKAEFLDLVTISQMTPGPIAINSATFVGLKIAGLGGAVVSTLGCILPSCVIVSVLAWVYLRYRKLDVLQAVLNSLRPAVVAMIAAAGLSIICSSLFDGEGAAVCGVNVQSAVIFAVCVVLLRWKKMNPIGVMALAGGLGVVLGGIKIG